MLINKIISLIGEDMNVNFEIVDRIEPSVSGKQKFIISHINHNFYDSLENGP